MKTTTVGNDSKSKFAHTSTLACSAPVAQPANCPDALILVINVNVNIHGHCYRVKTTTVGTCSPTSTGEAGSMPGTSSAPWWVSTCRARSPRSRAPDAGDTSAANPSAAPCSPRCPHLRPRGDAGARARAKGDAAGAPYVCPKIWISKERNTCA